MTLAAVRLPAFRSRLPITLASIQNMEGVGSGCCPKNFHFLVVYHRYQAPAAIQGVNKLSISQCHHAGIQCVKLLNTQTLPASKIGISRVTIGAYCSL